MDQFKSIKLTVNNNGVTEKTYTHKNVYNYREVAKILENFCNPKYNYDCNITKERMYRFMLGEVTGDKDEEVIEDVVGYEAMSLLGEFTNDNYPADYNFIYNIE